jgi:hypothetical protein
MQWINSKNGPLQNFYSVKLAGLGENIFTLQNKVLFIY